MSDDGSWIHVDFVFTVLLAVANAAGKKNGLKVTVKANSTKI